MADKFQIHIFTSEEHIESEAEILSGFLNSGLDCLHIRKPGWTYERVEELLRKLPANHLSKVTLHSYPELALKYKAGFQLNSRTGHIDFEPVSLSRSCHTLQEVEESSELDFVTLSPVFDSISKTGYKASGVIDGAEPDRFKTKVIALGGVELSRLDSLRSLGFSGAALLGSVWNTLSGISEMLKFLRMRNYRFQFITDGTDIQSTLAQAYDALDGGCQWLLIRMKNSDIGEIRETLQELLPHCEQKCATLIVDDYVELCSYCHGVHLGQNDIPVAEARMMLPEEKIVGLTANNLEQIKESETSLPDYYGIGPFRFTSTKKNLAPVLGLDGYRNIIPELNRPFVAIGGILPDDIPEMQQAGIFGYAVSSVITKSSDPVEMTSKLRKIINI